MYNYALEKNKITKKYKKLKNNDKCRKLQKKIHRQSIIKSYMR
jgi:hypothetical protein